MPCSTFHEARELGNPVRHARFITPNVKNYTVFCIILILWDTLQILGENGSGFKNAKS